MGLSVTPTNIPASWMRSLTRGSAKSTHFALAGIFNLMCLLALAKTFRILWAMRNSDPGLLLFLAFVLFFLAMATLSIWQVFRKARTELQEQDNPAALVLSYLALRLYICLLGVALMLLGTINLMHR